MASEVVGNLLGNILMGQSILAFTRNEGGKDCLTGNETETNISHAIKREVNEIFRNCDNTPPKKVSCFSGNYKLFVQFVCFMFKKTMRSSIIYRGKLNEYSLVLQHRKLGLLQRTLCHRAPALRSSFFLKDIMKMRIISS